MVNLDEIADRWQLPIAVIMYFITDLNMDPVCPEMFFVYNSDIILKEKQKVFEQKLFGPVLSKTTT